MSYKLMCISERWNFIRKPFLNSLIEYFGWVHCCGATTTANGEMEQNSGANDIFGQDFH